MRIAHLIAQFYPHLGGAEVCIHNVAGYMASEGHDTTVVCTTLPPAKAPERKYRTIHLPARTCGLLRRIPFLGYAHLSWQMRRLQRKFNFDLWQVTMGYPLGCHAWRTLRAMGVPGVLRCCGEDIQIMPEIDYGYRLDRRCDALIRRSYPNYDSYIAITPTVRDEYLKLGIQPGRIKVIPNGVDVGRFANTAPDMELRKSLTGGRDVPVILTVGRYHRKKGFDLIPKIAARLKESGVDFAWLVAGRGNSRLLEQFPDLKSLNIHIIEDTGGNGEGEPFALPFSRLVSIYRSADVFAFPTLIETLGIVILEAFAAGLPVLSTECPGVRDVIKDGFDGIKVAPGDPAAFAEALAALLRDKAQQTRLRSNALDTVRRNDWSEVSRQYLGLYRETLERHAAKS